MKSLIILLVVCAMASAADRYGGVNVVDNTRPYNNGQGQIIDPGFYRPTYPAGGPQRPDISPAWVQQPGNNDYRPKKFDDPRLRGGK